MPTFLLGVDDLLSPNQSDDIFLRPLSAPVPRVYQKRFHSPKPNSDRLSPFRRKSKAKSERQHSAPVKGRRSEQSRSTSGITTLPPVSVGTIGTLPNSSHAGHNSSGPKKKKSSSNSETVHLATLFHGCYFRFELLEYYATAKPALQVATSDDLPEEIQQKLGHQHVLGMVCSGVQALLVHRPPDPVRFFVTSCLEKNIQLQKKKIPTSVPTSRGVGLIADSCFQLGKLSLQEVLKQYKLGALVDTFLHYLLCGRVGPNAGKGYTNAQNELKEVEHDFRKCADALAMQQARIPTISGLDSTQMLVALLSDGMGAFDAWTMAPTSPMNSTTDNRNRSLLVADMDDAPSKSSPDHDLWGLTSIDTTPLMVAYLLSMDADPHARFVRDSDPREEDSHGPTILHLAARKGMAQIVCGMARTPVEPEVRAFAEGWSPLHVAAKAGKVDSILALLAVANARIETKDHQRRTPLHLAIEQGHVDSSLCLLNANANPNAQAHGNVCPIHVAAHAGLAVGLQVLLSSGADPAAKSSTGTPFHCLGLRDVWGCTQVLIQAGCDLAALNDDGLDPLAYHVSQGRHRIVKALLEAQADLNGPHPLSPLALACQSGCATTVRVLLSHGATFDGESMDLQGNPHEIQDLAMDHKWLNAKKAVFDNDYEGLTRALGQGLNPSTQDSAGDTFLMMAVLCSNQQITKYLLGLEVNANLCTTSGLSLLVWTHFTGHGDIADLLTEAGAALTSRDQQGLGLSKKWYREDPGAKQVLDLSSPSGTPWKGPILLPEQRVDIMNHVSSKTSSFCKAPLHELIPPLYQPQKSLIDTLNDIQDTLTEPLNMKGMLFGAKIFTVRQMLEGYPMKPTSIMALFLFVHATPLYKALNDVIESGDSSRFDVWRPLIYYFIDALDTMQRQQAIIYKPIQSLPFNVLWRPNVNFVWPSFSLGTTYETAMENWDGKGILFAIHVKYGVCLSPPFQSISGLVDVITQPNTTFKIKNVYKAYSSLAPGEALNRHQAHSLNALGVPLCVEIEEVLDDQTEQVAGLLSEIGKSRLKTILDQLVGELMASPNPPWKLWTLEPPLWRRHVFLRVLRSHPLEDWELVDGWGCVHHSVVYFPVPILTLDVLQKLMAEKTRTKQITSEIVISTAGTACEVAVLLAVVTLLHRSLRNLGWVEAQDALQFFANMFVGHLKQQAPICDDTMYQVKTIITGLAKPHPLGVVPSMHSVDKFHWECCGLEMTAKEIGQCLSRLKNLMKEIYGDSSVFIEWIESEEWKTDAVPQDEIARIYSTLLAGNELYEEMPSTLLASTFCCVKMLCCPQTTFTVNLLTEIGKSRDKSPFMVDLLQGLDSESCNAVLFLSQYLKQTFTSLSGKDQQQPLLEALETILEPTTPPPGSLLASPINSDAYNEFFPED